MAFVGRFYLFVCDFCQLRLETTTLPEDWYYCTDGKGGKLLHSCPKCWPIVVVGGKIKKMGTK